MKNKNPTTLELMGITSQRIRKMIESQDADISKKRSDKKFKNKISKNKNMKIVFVPH